MLAGLGTSHEAIRTADALDYYARAKPSRERKRPPDLSAERPKSREETPKKGMHRERCDDEAIPHCKKIKPPRGAFSMRDQSGAS